MSSPRKLTATVTLLFTLVSLVGPSRADVDLRAALERFFTADSLKAEWFAPSFLDAVPFAQLQPVRDRLVGDLGAFEGVQEDGDHWLAEFESAELPVHASLDAQGRFVGLRLLPPVGRVGSLEEAMADLDEQPGRAAFLVRRDGEELASRDADRPLAVGSTFKLVVLDALQRAIEAGEHRWNEAIGLREEWRSLPSGILQSWPDDAPVTLHTLAALMISQSDNTATDHLIRLLGRRTVEAADPSGRNRPFLTTAEAFRLKDPANEDLLERWRAGDEEERRSLLEELAERPLPPGSIFDRGPRAVDVEWSFTAHELCELVERVADLELTGINPGVATADHWRRVAYKGGSEPGVLNLTTRVEREDGVSFCVCATRNADSEVSLSELSSVVTAVLRLLRED